MGGSAPASQFVYIRAMSGICGYVGDAPPEALERMLGAISYRGDRNDTASLPGVGLGYRWWNGRPNKSPGIHRGPAGTLVACAGTLAPAVPSPAQAIDERLGRPGQGGLADLDGAFGAARWDAQTRTLTLIRDPFGVRSLYWVQHEQTFYFATELKQLLALGRLPLDVDPAVVHKYLTFSFVPGEPTPLRGIRRLPPGHLLTLVDGKVEITPYFELREEIVPIEQAEASRQTWQLGRAAVQRRLVGEERVGLYLSGGIDSSAVGVWLADLGANVQAFTLDFGADSVEREEATGAAQHLGIPLERVPADGNAIASIFDDLVYKLDLPFGDPVTGPHFLLGRAARSAGLIAVFNGEGGDQLFGGWTSKPMVAAAVYGDEYGEETPEQQYLKSYHRFYGLEDELYNPDFAASVGGPGQRRALIAKYLGGDAARTLLNRVRLTDIALKGSQNILPRAERMTNAHGLDARVPLFDRQLATWSFTLPTNLKLHGACEKYVLKLSMQKRLPEPLVWRRKFGMSVPVTDWLLGPLRPLVDELLGDRSVHARGWFRPELIRQLREGHDVPSETRRRRIGEKLWTLLMLEAWMRRFVDQKGAAP
jgi:asparagine synthase (glutamine-hydrolysing)